MFFRFCDIAIIIECTSTHTYMHTHTYSPNIPSMKYQIMKHCYTNKSDDPRGKLCAIRACLCPDNCGEHGLLREFSSWSQGPSDLRRLRCLWLEKTVTHTCIHTQGTIAINGKMIFVRKYEKTSWLCIEV